MLKSTRKFLSFVYVAGMVGVEPHFFECRSGHALGGVYAQGSYGRAQYDNVEVVKVSRSTLLQSTSHFL